MKKKLVLTALLISTLLTTTVSAAVLNGETAPNIKVVINGVIQNFKDGNGNKVEPVIINGVTYLPLRSVADAFGKTVDWNGNTSTITIGNVNNSIASTNLVDVVKTKQGDLNKITGESNLTFPNIGEGAKFQTAVKIEDIDTYDQGGSLNIDGSYKKLSGTLLFIPGTSKVDCTVTITNADNDMIILEKTFAQNTLVQINDVDITGISKLGIHAKSGKGFGQPADGTLYFLNPVVK